MIAHYMSQPVIKPKKKTSVVGLVDLQKVRKW